MAGEAFNETQSETSDFSDDFDLTASETETFDEEYEFDAPKWWDLLTESSEILNDSYTDPFDDWFVRRAPSPEPSSPVQCLPLLSPRSLTAAQISRLAYQPQWMQVAQEVVSYPNVTPSPRLLDACKQAAQRNELQDQHSPFMSPTVMRIKRRQRVHMPRSAFPAEISNDNENMNAELTLSPGLTALLAKHNARTALLAEEPLQQRRIRAPREAAVPAKPVHAPMTSKQFAKAWKKEKQTADAMADLKTLLARHNATVKSRK